MSRKPLMTIEIPALSKVLETMDKMPELKSEIRCLKNQNERMAKRIAKFEEESEKAVALAVQEKCQVIRHLGEADQYFRWAFRVICEQFKIDLRLPDVMTTKDIDAVVNLIIGKVKPLLKNA